MARYAACKTGGAEIQLATPTRVRPLLRHYPRRRRFFDPNSLTRENTQVSPLTDKGYQTDDYYTDAISDHAVRYIEEHKGDQPFFLYVAYTAPHWPMRHRKGDRRLQGLLRQGMGRRAQGTVCTSAKDGVDRSEMEKLAA